MLPRGWKLRAKWVQTGIMAALSLPPALLGKHKRNQGACKAPAAHRDIQEAKTQVTAWRDISRQSLSASQRSPVLLPWGQGHLLPTAVGPYRPAKLQLCHGWCESSGWWLPAAADSIHAETFRRGNVLRPSKSLIFPTVSTLPDHSEHEKSPMLLLNTQRGYKTHKLIFHCCCFPPHNKGRDLITRKLY